MVANTVHARKCIHDRQTPHRDQEDEYPISSNSDSELEFEESNTSRSFHINERLEKSRSVSRINKRPVISLEKADEAPRSSQISKKLLYIAAFTLLIAIYICWPQKIENKICSFEKLKKSYPKEEDKVWTNLKVGIETILNHKNKHPAVYLFANNGSKHAFNLIEAIAVHSSSCFGKELIPMKSEDFMSTVGPTDDYGHAIEKYKTKIKEGNVILIANLNEIPAKAARALHSICDTHSPINKNAVIFLKLTIEGSRKGNANARAEETLMELWGSKLERNELDALITRVTDEVITLQS